MENENQKPKLNLDDIFNIKNEICDSIKGGCADCPFDQSSLCSILTDVWEYRDKIKTICTEWEENRPTIAKKINEILKPYGMKLMHDYHYIWFNDGDMKAHTQAELINKLYTTKWKGEPNE